MFKRIIPYILAAATVVGSVAKADEVKHYEFHTCALATYGQECCGVRNCAQEPRENQDSHNWWFLTKEKFGRITFSGVFYDTDGLNEEAHHRQVFSIDDSVKTFIDSDTASHAAFAQLLSGVTAQQREDVLAYTAGVLRELYGFSPKLSEEEMFQRLAVQHTSPGTMPSVGRCGPIHNYLRELAKDSGVSSPVNFSTLQNDSNGHIALAYHGENGWNIQDYAEVISTKTFDLITALEIKSWYETHVLWQSHVYDGKYLFSLRTRDGEILERLIDKVQDYRDWAEKITHRKGVYGDAIHVRADTFERSIRGAVSIEDFSSAYIKLGEMQGNFISPLNKSPFAQIGYSFFSNEENLERDTTGALDCNLTYARLNQEGYGDDTSENALFFKFQMMFSPGFRPRDAVLLAPFGGFSLWADLLSFSKKYPSTFGEFMIGCENVLIRGQHSFAIIPSVIFEAVPRDVVEQEVTVFNTENAGILRYQYKNGSADMFEITGTFANRREENRGTLSLKYSDNNSQFSLKTGIAESRFRNLWPNRWFVGGELGGSFTVFNTDFSLSLLSEFEKSRIHEEEINEYRLGGTLSVQF